MEILNHNYFSLESEIKNIRNAIKRGELRNLVENRVRSNPYHTTILKLIDKNYYNFLELRTPVANIGKIIATTKESFYRLVILRF